VIDEVRSAERGTGDDYASRCFIRFPFFAEEEMALIHAHPYLSRGDRGGGSGNPRAAGLDDLTKSLNRYLFPARAENNGTPPRLPLAALDASNGSPRRQW